MLVSFQHDPSHSLDGAELGKAEAAGAPGRLHLRSNLLEWQ
jgi:hypothetical protein